MHPLPPLPSSCALLSPRPWFVWVLLMKDFDGGGVPMVFRRLLSGLSVASLFDIVPEAVAGDFGVQDFLNLILKYVIYNNRWWWRDKLSCDVVVWCRVK